MYNNYNWTSGVSLAASKLYLANEFNKKTNTILCFIILKDNIRKNAKETLEYFKKQGSYR